MVVDPENPLPIPLGGLQPQCTPAPRLPDLVQSYYLGDNHSRYEGSYRALSRVKFDWTGQAIVNWQGADQLGGTYYGTTHRLISDVIGANSCTEEATPTCCVTGSLTGLTSFTLGYSAKNPMVGLAPTNDGTVNGSFAPDGTLTLGFHTDGFPSHGLQVTRQGTVQLTATLNDASCLSNYDVLGAAGAYRLLKGLNGQFNATGTLTVAPADSGRVVTQFSGLC